MPEMFDQKIEQCTLIYASPEKVYDTITSAAEWDSFFTTGMQIDPRPGGICSFAWKEWGPSKYTHTVPGVVMECACGWGEAVTLLKFYIEHGMTYRAALSD